MLLIKCLLLITFVLGPSTSLVDHVTNIENNLTPDHKLGSLVLYIYKSKQKKKRGIFNLTSQYQSILINSE